MKFIFGYAKITNDFVLNFWWTFNDFLANLAKDISFCTISNEKKKKYNNRFLKVVFSDTKVIFWMQHYMSWSHRIL